MLENVGLPTPWEFVKYIPFGKDRELEDAFAFSVHEDDLNDKDVSVEGKNKTPESVAGWRTFSHSWELIREGPEGGREVYLRMQKNKTGEVRVSSVVFLPHGYEWSVTGKALRALPIAAIEEAIRNANFEVKAILEEVFGVPFGDALAPLGVRRGDENFSAKVARQFLALKETYANPTGEMAAINGVGPSTAQGWVTAARKEGFLPPGRPGRAG
jgi:hypothetical protein